MTGQDKDTLFAGYFCFGFERSEFYPRDLSADDMNIVKTYGLDLFQNMSRIPVWWLEMDFHCDLQLTALFEAMVTGWADKGKRSVGGVAVYGEFRGVLNEKKRCGHCGYYVGELRITEILMVAPRYIMPVEGMGRKCEQLNDSSLVCRYPEYTFEEAWKLAEERTKQIFNLA